MLRRLACTGRPAAATARRCLVHRAGMRAAVATANMPLRPTSWRLFSDDASGDGDGDVDEEAAAAAALAAKEERKRAVREQAARVRLYEEEVNQRRKLFAAKHAAEQAAKLRAEEEERVLVQQMKAQRKALKATRVAANIARAAELTAAQREVRRLRVLAKGIERKELEKLLQARREEKVVRVAVQAENFVPSLDEAEALVDSALDAETREPWSRLFQKN